MNKELNDYEVEQVKKQAREKLGACRKTNEVIGTQIFMILGLYARVIYYPLGVDAPWGFTRISGSKNDSKLEKPFVVINSSIPTSNQIFAAAHELYHIWYESNPDYVSGHILDDGKKEKNEMKANRFAAEFLVDEMMLRQELQIYGESEITIKQVLQMANLFKVPYKAMVRRMRETNLITENEKRKFLEESDETIGHYRRMYAYFTADMNNEIVVDNLAELSTKAYKKVLITFEKYEYLLGICGLNPSDLGINKRKEKAFPMEEELDKIM